MANIKLLFKNTFYMTVAYGLQPFLNIILVLVIGRILGKAVFGKYTTIFFIVQIFQVISSFGIKIYLTREVAKHKERVTKFLSNGALISIPFALIGIVALIAITSLLNYEADVKLGCYIASISLIAHALSESMEGVLAGLQRLGKVAKVWVLFLSIKVFFSVLFVYLNFGLIALIIIHVIAKFVKPFVLMHYLKGIITGFRFTFDFSFAKNMISTIWTFAFIMIIVSIFWRIDAIMISKMRTFEEVGIYGAAYKFFWIFILFVRSFFTAFFPMISSELKENKLSFERFLRKSLKYLIISLIPIILFFAFFSKDVISFVWGSKYYDSINVLRIMIMILLPYAITEVFAYSLIATDNQHIDLKLNFIALIVKVAMNYFLITRFGIIGAIYSTLISLSVLFVFQLPVVFNRIIHLKIQIIYKDLAKIIAASVVTIAFIVAFSRVNTVGAMIFSLPVYFLTIFLFRTISDNDISVLKNLMSRT